VKLLRRKYMEVARVQVEEDKATSGKSKSSLPRLGPACVLAAGLSQRQQKESTNARRTKRKPEDFLSLIEKFGLQAVKIPE
jgi:hypothetical protein